MRKLLCLLTVFACVASYAQKGSMSVGVQAGYGTEIESFGSGVNFTYNVTDKLALVPSFDYFFGKDESGVKSSMWDFNADVHYNFTLSDKFVVYPFAGFTYTSWSAEVSILGTTVSSTDGYYGANLGGGVMYDVTPSIGIGAELKYQLLTGDGSDGSQIVYGVKAVYKF